MKWDVIAGAVVFPSPCFTFAKLRLTTIRDGGGGMVEKLFVVPVYLAPWQCDLKFLDSSLSDFGVPEI